MRKESMDFFENLLSAPSPSGYEVPGQKIWCEYAAKYADEVTTDSYGNAIAVLNPGGGTKIMLDGHADEIGLMIKHIDEKGFIYFQRVGGVSPDLVSGKRVNIHTPKGIVRGVVAATPVHLRDRDKEPKMPKMHEVFIDIGAANDKDARKKVKVGDLITFVDDFEMLNKNIAVARGMDNRVGTWVAIETLRVAKALKPTCAVYACSSIQEELGLHGAHMNVFNVNPDAAIAIDVTPATDSPGIDVKQFGEVKLGKGPTIEIGRENHPVLVERLSKIAAAKKIDVQKVAFSQCGGTDALAIFKAMGGVPSVVVSIPNRYTHSTVEMVDLRDVEAAVKLLAGFVASVKKGERFAVKI